MRRNPSQTSRTTWFILIALAVGLGWMYRSADLAKRPMHTDEAVLGMKTIELYDTGRFKYDPQDYHGPFLHWATKWIGATRGWTSANLDEARLRTVTVFFGMLLVLVPLLLRDVLGRRGSGIAALLIAVSPLMTYYSRYYIMETPFAVLVSLFMVVGWRWTQSRNPIWLVLAGVALGLMHATKETFVLNLAAMFAGWTVAKGMVGSFEPRRNSLSLGSSSRREGSMAGAATIVIVIAVLVSVAMFSNGFRDWTGVRDSVLTFENYLKRSSGQGHAKPWHYYITLLFWRKNVFTWSEALIGGLAIIGIFNAFTNDRRPSHHRAFLIFLSVYTIALLAAYSILSYKTPWSILCVDHALALLAGVGMSGIFRALETNPLVKTVVLGLFAAGLYNLCLQTSLAIDFNFPTPRYSADERNPYAYAHTVPNLVQLSKRIHDLADKSPAGKKTSVWVIESQQGWPLGWYLRDLKNVGYGAEVPDRLDADLIVVDLVKDEQVRAKLHSQYVASPYGLRPGIILDLFVKQAIWDRFTGVEPSPAAPPPAPAPGSTPPPPAPAASTPEPAAAAMPPPGSPGAPPRAQIVTDDVPTTPAPAAPTEKPSPDQPSPPVPPPAPSPPGG